MTVRWAIKLGGVLVSERVGRGNKNGRLKTLQVADEFLAHRARGRYRARVARAGLVGLCDTEGHTLLRMALTLSLRDRCRVCQCEAVETPAIGTETVLTHVGSA